jgi:hypothetical protein
MDGGNYKFLMVTEFWLGNMKRINYFKRPRCRWEDSIK